MSRIVKSVISATWIGVSLVIVGCQDEPPYPVTPYPDFISEVQPDPGGMFSTSDPSSRNLYYSPSEGAGDVCVEILQQPLLRPGDQYYQFENVQLSINETVITTDQYHAPSDESVSVEFENEIATGVYSDLVCWDVVLSPGEYDAQLLVWTSTGEEFTYSWSFAVSE